MKKLAIATLLVVAGCRGQAPVSGPARIGGAGTPREAIERFIGAAKAQDYDGVSLAFGTADGPARTSPPKSLTRAQRKTWPEDLKKREFIFMRCLRNDRFQVGGETPTPTGTRVAGVQLWFKDVTASTSFTLVEGPSGRWYVQDLKLDDLQPICTSL